MSNPIKCPWEIIKLDKENDEKIRKVNAAVGINYVQIGPKKFLQRDKYEKFFLNFYNFKVRNEDVWLFGCARSGTTLTQEMLWIIGNNLDYKGASQDVLDHRFPVIEHAIFMDGNAIKKRADNSDANTEVKNIAAKYVKPHWQQLEETTKKRFMKSHLPMSLMPSHIFESGCKIVYCARHPKDVIVSRFKFMNFFRPKDFAKVDFSSFWNLFKNNLVENTPYFEHVKEGWKKRNDPNFLFLFYEETNKNKRQTLEKIAKFLGKKLSEKDLDTLENHLQIDNFRKNKSVNNDHFVDIGIAKKTEEYQFIGKGVSGGWKKYFTPELNAEADKWIEENLLGSDLVLPLVN